MSGESAGKQSLEECLAVLPSSLRGFFQKILDGVMGALQTSLIDTLVGEFHEKFNQMWNNPGDRYAARALRQCDRTHREIATRVVNEVLVSQLALLAKAVGEMVKKVSGGDDGASNSILCIIESKVTRLEAELSAIEEAVQ